MKKGISIKKIYRWEEILVKKAAAGDAVAMDLLVERYRPELQAKAMRLLQNSEDAHDVVQETFLKVHRKIHEFDTSRKFEPWLKTICHNACIDLIRSRRKHENLDAHEFMIPDRGPSLENKAEEARCASLLEEAIDRLPIRYREAIRLRLYSQMSVEAIAGTLGKPEGTIKSWLYRARTLLQNDPSLQTI
ncbi:MAG: RNA polymerase sigma factor [Fimbriimonadaceae bacterium]